jgi:hypothetical protein
MCCLTAHKALTGGQSGDKLTAYIHFVIRSVDSLKFILAWNSRTKRRGGKKWKTEYREAAFLQQCEADIAKLRRTLNGDNLERRVSKLKKTFVGKHEKLITSRNHLLKLYNTVS